MIHISRTLTIDPRLISESFVRGTGPGGQNVNKVATAVELRFDLVNAGLPEDVRTRAASLAGHRLTTEGVIVIQAHENRTQKQNREAARARLIDLLTKAAIRPKARRKTKPSKTAKERRLTSKHHRGEIKKYRGGRPEDD
jgi:ribosome-associated protein